jgi:hypothetical protein
MAVVIMAPGVQKRSYATAPRANSWLAGKYKRF